MSDEFSFKIINKNIQIDSSNFFKSQDDFQILLMMIHKLQKT